MHDPVLKSVFGNRDMIGILIRDHVPQWAGEIDFSTLREEATELVSKKTLQRRHPDMIWSANTADGRRVVFLIEFQRTAERFMALRTTTYAALTLERIAAGADFRSGDPLPEFVCLVLYHGDRPWRAPDHVTDLFERSDPGRFLLVSWKDEERSARPGNDITALVLGLARNLSPEDMAMQVAALRRRVAERADARLGTFLADRVVTMLELRGYTQKLLLGGAKTMDELDDRFRRGLDELVQRGARQGQAMVLRRQVVRRFGEDTAGQVSEVIEGLPGPDGIDRVTDALFECATGEEFIERVRTA